MIMQMNFHRFILPFQSRFFNRSSFSSLSLILSNNAHFQFRSSISPLSLIGPPQLYNNPSTKSESQESTAVPGNDDDHGSESVSSNPFIDLMVANFNNSNPVMGYTENMSPTYLSSGNPCLDFFFHIVPNTDSDSLTERLSLSWKNNPLTTLKLVFNLRGIRGTGKSDKEGFYKSAVWMHQNHPKTLACNVPFVADFGYFKDLPEILYRLLEGLDVRQIQKGEWLMKKNAATKSYKNGKLKKDQLERKKKKKENKWERKINGIELEDREIRIARAMEKSKLEKEMASVERNKKRLSMAIKALERYTTDPDFQFLYDSVSDFFAECLKSDIQFLNSGDFRKVSLAAKWCPSLRKSFDRSTLLCESIARRIFPRESYPEYEGIEEAHYAYRVRDRLRKEILVPLRKALELPEIYIGANQWDSIPYNRVASVAMSLYKDKFLKHDGDRFVQYLEDVKAGNTTIAAGALLPHKILESLKDSDGGVVAELQWKRMVDDLLKIGKLRNCIAVCDVSGSMEGIPMEVSVALGILVSELSEDPWKGKVITFSRNPELHLIKGDDLKSKSEFVRQMDWGTNTDFQKVFDMILKVAVDGKLKEEEMIKRVFVFSDMEFDQASNNSWETDYQVIVRKFTEKGYGSVVPQIVFWNLRDSMATPVPATEEGVALLSGFSKNLIKLFLDNDGTINPELAMEMALSGEEYQKLAVVD